MKTSFIIRQEAHKQELPPSDVDLRMRKNLYVSYTHNNLYNDNIYTIMYAFYISRSSLNYHVYCHKRRYM